MGENQDIRASFAQSLPDVKDCDVCEEKVKPSILVEVSQGEDEMKWIGACSDECLQKIILRWKVIGDIVCPGRRIPGQDGIEGG